MECGDEALDVLKGRIVKEIAVEEYNSRKIVSFTTHDGLHVILSGGEMVITSQDLR